MVPERPWLVNVVEDSMSPALEEVDSDKDVDLPYRKSLRVNMMTLHA
jgi:hypothetical protein